MVTPAILTASKLQGKKKKKNYKAYLGRRLAAFSSDAKLMMAGRGARKKQSII